MNGPKLTLVPGSPETPMYDLGRGPESTADRVKRLQQEARLLAREEVDALEKRLQEAVAQARSITAGGEAYPAGVRELADRISNEIEARLQTLTAIAARTFES